MEMASTLRAQSKGAKLIVVDPRRSDTAAKADLWLQIRPATDAALALGMINVMINEQLFDKEFVDKWTVGFDQLKERVQQYLPEKVAVITTGAGNPETYIQDSSRQGNHRRNSGCG